MLILDRYIARQYLTNIAILLVLLFSFVIMIDLTLNMHRFISIAEKQALENGVEISGLRKLAAGALLVVDLWLPRLPQMYNFIIGLVLIGAMGFTVAQLVRHRELVAVMASGVSLYRLMRPILLVATMMLLVQAVNQELLLPRLAPLLVRENEEAGKREIGAFQVNGYPDDERRLFYAVRFEKNRMDDVNITERDSQLAPVQIIRAKSASWDEARKVWVLEQGLAERKSADNAPSAARYTPVATVRTSLDPNSIRAVRFQSLAYNLSTAEIADLLARPTLRDDVKEQLRRIVWGRAANYLCVLLSLVVAMPFFLTREPKNMVMQSIKCAPVAVGSIVGSTVAILSPIPGLSVEVAVFLPVIALLPTAIAMGTSVKT